MGKIKEILNALTDGDEEFLQELSEAYLENFEEFKLNASQAIEQEDIDALKDYIHKVKPTFFTLEQSSEFDMINDIAENFDKSKISDYLRQVTELIDPLIGGLKEA